MPTWQRRVTGTTTTPGFWTGTTTETRADNCDTAAKAAIEGAFATLDANPGLNCFPAMRDDMRSRWPTVAINCCVNGQRLDADGLTASIFICNMSDRQIQIALVLGLVLGTPLDKRAMVMACFGAPDGLPSTAEFNAMTGLPTLPGVSNEHLGDFCVWNRTTGEVFDRSTATQGGFWTSSTVPAKGNRCFVNTGWVF